MLRAGVDALEPCAYGRILGNGGCETNRVVVRETVRHLTVDLCQVNEGQEN